MCPMALAVLRQQMVKMWRVRRHRQVLLLLLPLTMPLSDGACYASKVWLAAAGGCSTCCPAGRPLAPNGNST